MVLSQVQLFRIYCLMELTDQKIWEVTKILYNQFKNQETARKLDVDRLAQFKKANVKPLYPHKAVEGGDIAKYTCGQACCTVDPGNFCCCKTSNPDPSFRKLGMGMCLYFKFMKHSTIVFWIIAFLSIISCLVCFLVSVQNQFSPTRNYNNFFFSSTLGTFSAEHIKCQYSTLTGNTVPFTLSCPYGEISPIGYVYSEESDNTLLNCKTQIKKYQIQDSTYSMAGSVVTSTNSCAGTLKQCSTTLTITPVNVNFKRVAYAYQCKNQIYQIGMLQAKSQYLLYFVVSIDLFCCIIMALFYISQSKAEDKEIQFFKSQQISLSDFSLKIKGFNLATIDEEFNVMVRSIGSILGKQFQQQLVQIKMPDSQDFIDYQNKKEEGFNELFTIIDQQFFDKETNPNQFRTAQDFVNRNFNEGQYQKYKQTLTKYTTEYASLEYHPNSEGQNKKVSIFIVFNSIKMKKKVYEMQEDGCFSRYFKFQNREYTVSEPPAPDLIQWKNKGKWTFLRLFFSWIITLSICFGSYMLFGYIQMKQNNLLKDYNFSIDCNLLYPTTSTLLTFNSGLNSASPNYLSCFCSTNLLNFDNPDYYRCYEWRSQYITFLAIPIVISLLLVIYNIIVSSIFKVLTSFECHRLITDQLYSYTIKRAFILVLNMGIIMILLNMKFTNDVGINEVGFLFQGKFNDISADWYISIGSIIIMTMIFNITFPIIQLVLANIVKCFKKCWDKKCCFRKTSCKTKNEYIKLFSDDVYPIEERYAFLVSILLITMAFSCIIPILNVICAFSLMLLYFSDKVLVFKVYQTPINYNAELHRIINKTIYIGLIAHMALSAFFLSEASLIAPNSSFLGKQALNSGNTRINSIISVYYIIPYVVLFLLFAGWSVFSNTLLAFCQKCSALCKKNLSNITEYKLQQNFYDSLNEYQTNRLKLLVESQINKLATKKSNFKSNTIDSGTNILNDTLKQFNSGPHKMSQHEALLRRTFLRLKSEEGLRLKKRDPTDAFLIGPSAYEIMMNEEAFEQNKKNIILTEALNFCLKDILQSIKNDQL